MWDRFQVGDTVPPVVRSAGEVQLFLFSAATWNPHRIHYDRDFAKLEGHTDLLVHGPLVGAWLAEYVCDWAGGRNHLRRIAWRNVSSLHPGERVTIWGTITALAVEADERVVQIRLIAEADGPSPVATGEAEVALSPVEPSDDFGDRYGGAQDVN